MRIGDWSADVCSSVLYTEGEGGGGSGPGPQSDERDQTKKGRGRRSRGPFPWANGAGLHARRQRLVGIGRHHLDDAAGELALAIAISEIDEQADHAPEDRKSTRLNSSH